MATTLLPILRYLRKLGTPIDAPDADLLARFISDGDGEAFAALVRRHGPMVLGVCRRILRDGHGAEDAFQATFLVLARKAPSLARPDRLAAWLHGVAYRIALRARSDAVRRRIHEARASAPEAVGPDDALIWRDLRPLLDDAIAGLPEKYRTLVVLCYLEGRTNAEAAALLGCPRGTVATRLARARELLRERLSRSGLTLTATLFAAIPAAVARAAVLGELLTDTLRTATGGAVPAAVAVLMKGAERAMTFSGWKIVGCVALLAGLIGAGAASYRAAEAPTESKAGFTLRLPSGEPSAALLVAYLNDNARRVRTLQATIDVDALKGNQGIGMTGQMACRKPRDLRVVLKVLGKEAVDFGSNEQECWFWCSKAEPPNLLRFTHKELVRGKARWPFPFGPNAIPECLGIAEHDPAGRYEVKAGDKTIELIEKTRSPQGVPVRKVTVFNRSSDQPQIAGYRMEDTQGKVISITTISKVHLDKESGATLATRMKIEWPAEKVQLRVALDDLRVNKSIDRERAAKLFTVPGWLDGQQHD